MSRIWLRACVSASPDERLPRVEMEQVVADRGAVGGDDLAGLRRRMACSISGVSSPRLSVPRLPPSFAGGILRVLLGERREVLAFLHRPYTCSAFLRAAGPALLLLAGLGQEQDVARLEREARLELVAVVLEVPVDLLLGDGDAQRDLAARDPLHQDLVADAAS